MKKKNEIRILLNLTQQDMASLLGVSRSHYTMYESGQRRLPTEATRLLARLLAQTVTEPGKNKKANQKEKKTLHLSQVKLLQQLLYENEYQTLLVSKKIEAATKKHTANLSRLQLVEKMNVVSGKATDEQEKVLSMLSKTSKLIPVGLSEVIFRLEIRKELLALEKDLLESKVAEASITKL